MNAQSKQRSIDKGDPHWIEWLTGVVSMAFVLALIGWIGWDAIGPRDTAPELSVRMLGTSAEGAGYHVRFEIANAAKATAAGVVVRGEIRDGGRTLETIEMTLDYVPMKSTAQGGLIFTSDPEGRSVRVSAVGYSDP